MCVEGQGGATVVELGSQNNPGNPAPTPHWPDRRAREERRLIKPHPSTILILGLIQDSGAHPGSLR